MRIVAGAKWRGMAIYRGGGVLEPRERLGSAGRLSALVLAAHGPKINNQVSARHGVNNNARSAVANIGEK